MYIFHSRKDGVIYFAICLPATWSTLLQVKQRWGELSEQERDQTIQLAYQIVSSGSCWKVHGGLRAQ
jgi:hypothetical protein